MNGLLLGAVVAGLAGAPHCLGMCGSLACAAGPRPAQQVPYQLGRLTTYATLGAIAGSVGQVIPGPHWVGSSLGAVLLVLFSASLAGLLPEPSFKLPGLTTAGAQLAGRTGMIARFLFGVVNGLLPCGLVYATLSVPVALGNPWEGALAMALFGVATVPALLVAVGGLRSVLSRSLAARRALAAVVLVAGLSSLGYREGLFRGPQHTAPATHQE